MSDIYGDLTYSKGRSKYFGLPVEQEEKTLNALQEKFDTNEAKWDELRTSILDSDFLDTEQDTIDSELQNAHDKMGSIIDTNNFHLAKSSVRKAVDGFTRSENVKVAKEKKANYIAYDADLKERRKKYKPGEHGGITDEDYNYALKMWKSQNAGYTHVVDGEIKNKVQSFDVVEQVDFKKYFLDIAKNLKASNFTENTQIVVNGEPTTVKKAFGSIGDFYQSFEAKGVDDPRNLAVMESIMKDHPVMQRLRYETERDINNSYGVRGKDGLFTIGRDGKPITDITIDDIPSNYVDGTTVYFTKPMRHANGLPVYKTVGGEQKLQYIDGKAVDLNDLDKEEQGMILREAMEYHYLASREQELDNFAIAFSYKELETKYMENWRARERFKNRLEKEVPVVQTNTAAGTTVATQRYGEDLKVTSANLLTKMQEFKDNGGKLENIQTIAGENSPLGVQATAILNYRSAILSTNKQIKQGLTNITQAEIEAQFPLLKSNPTESKRVMQNINESRTILTNYTSNNALPVTPFIIENGKRTISPEWKAYQIANGVPEMENDEIFKLYGVPKEEQRKFVKASNHISKNKNLIKTPDREVHAYGSSSTTGNKEMDGALKTATDNYFNNGQNKVVILQSNNEDATTGAITNLSDVNNLIHATGRRLNINLDRFTILKTEDVQHGQTFVTDKAKVVIEDNGLVTKNGTPHSTKTIKIITNDGKIVETITLGATVGTDQRSNLAAREFDGLVKQARSDEIRGAMQTGRDIYEVVNGYSVPVVINENGEQYYIQERTNDNKDSPDYIYHRGGIKITGKKVPIPQSFEVENILANEANNPNRQFNITYGR